MQAQTSTPVTATPALYAVYSLLEIETPERIVYFLDQMLQGWIGSNNVGNRPIQQRLDIFDTYRNLRLFVESVGAIKERELSEDEEDSAMMGAILSFNGEEAVNKSENNLTILREGWQDSPFADFEGFAEEHKILDKIYCSLCDFVESLI